VFSQKVNFNPFDLGLNQFYLDQFIAILTQLFIFMCIEFSCDS
jgi:hypothetical protein